MSSNTRPTAGSQTFTDDLKVWSGVKTPNPAKDIADIDAGTLVAASGSVSVQGGEAGDVDRAVAVGCDGFCGAGTGVEVRSGERLETSMPGRGQIGMSRTTRLSQRGVHLLEGFGDAGRHARSAVGMRQLHYGKTVQTRNALSHSRANARARSAPTVP